MKYKIYNYDGFRNNIGHAVTPHMGEETILLLLNQELSEVEILGIESIVKSTCKIYEGLNCNVVISMGTYNVDRDRVIVRSTSPNAFITSLYEKSFNDVSEELNDSEKNCLIKNGKNIISIEYNNVLRKNRFLGKFFAAKKDIVITYGEKDFDRF